MYTYKHFIRTDDHSRIIHGFSTAFEQPQPGDICINEQGGYQFRLFPGGEENPLLRSIIGNVPLYKWDGNKIVERAPEEIAADMPPPVPHIDPRDTEIAALRAKIDQQEADTLAIMAAVTAMYEAGGAGNE